MPQSLEASTNGSGLLLNSAIFFCYLLHLTHKAALMQGCLYFVSLFDLGCIPDDPCPRADGPYNGIAPGKRCQGAHRMENARSAAKAILLFLQRLTHALRQSLLRGQQTLLDKLQSMHRTVPCEHECRRLQAVFPCYKDLIQRAVQARGLVIKPEQEPVQRMLHGFEPLGEKL